MVELLDQPLKTNQEKLELVNVGIDEDRKELNVGTWSLIMKKVTSLACWKNI